MLDNLARLDRKRKTAGRSAFKFIILFLCFFCAAVAGKAEKGRVFSFNSAYAKQAVKQEVEQGAKPRLQPEQGIKQGASLQEARQAKQKTSQKTSKNQSAPLQEEITFRLQTAQARKKTILAIQAFKQGRYDLARKYMIASHDPLSAKIYYWMLFNKGRKKWNPALFVNLTRFIRKNPNWPGVARLKSLVEEVMPEQLSGAEVLAWYNDYPPKTGKGMSRYMDALITSGDKAAARAYMVDWWASTLISRSQQREIFRKYGQYLTLEAHKRRFDALLLNGKYESAKAIAEVLGHGYPELAAARIALAKQKKDVGRLIRKVPRYLQSDPGLLYERLKWRRKNGLDYGAMKILHKAPDVDKIQNPKAWWRERQIIIRRLIERGSYTSAYLLASKHMQKEGLPFAEAQWLAGWLALRFVHKPTKAYEYFTALYDKVTTPISKGRAAYWAGRAAYDLKQHDLAKKWYEKAAIYQTVFYGQLAAANLHGKGRFSKSRLPGASLPSLSRKDKERFAKTEYIQAAKLFHSAGMNDEAGRFLQSFISVYETPKAYRYGAELAAKMGQYNDAVRIAKKATRKGLFLTVQAYPTITKWMKKAGISDVEMALVHAIIRQESMFNDKAVSPAGARGLMQLMPATAREVAKKMKVSHKTSWLTQRPNYNIKIGSAYLARILKRYDYSYPLAIAAYNAGPGRVDKWLETYGDPRKGEVNLIDWIELIPFSETRNYVQRVLESVYIYRLRLHKVQKKPKYKLHLSASIR